MDVTSLLNFSNGAAEQQNQEARQTPPARNRTPWDAGGYSLPINTSNHTAVSTSTIVGNEIGNGCIHIHSYESQPIEIAKSPHHKFSDSRSSLSSISSATNSTANSTTHSRFSSLSTINSIHHFSFCNNSNIIFDNSTDLNRSSESSTTPQIECHSAPASPTDIRGLRPSPTESLDALAALAEQQQVFQRTGNGQKYRSQSMAAVPSITNLVDEFESMHPDDTNHPKRSGSPSDLMLMPRSNQQASGINNGDGENGSLTQEKSDRLSSATNANSSTLSLKTHKRTSSAPNLPRNARQPSRAPSPSVTPASELAPHVVTDQPDVTSPVDSAASNIHDGDADADGEIDSDQVPKFWVHYCRKHYQRSRYRNPKEYAKLQCALVQQQIRRVHNWSQQNMDRGQAGVVQDWGLAIRKREQLRLDGLNSKSRKRRAASDAQDDEEDDNDASRVNPRPLTAVPDWLLGLCGKGYSTEEILSIFNRLHTEILEDVMPCFPDIEILPNITVDQEEPKSPKGYTKRKPANVGHKRSQSLGGGLGNGIHQPQHSASSDRRPSQPVNREIGNGTPGKINQEPHPEKRRKINHPTEESTIHQHPTNPTFGRHAQAPHRPQFSSIDEDLPLNLSRFEDATKTYIERSHSYAQSQMPQTHGSPLPAPVPQRLNARSVANFNQFGNGDQYTMQASSSRPSHHRSQSDMVYDRGGMQHSMSGARHYNHNVESTIPRYQHPPFSGVPYTYRDERPRQQSHGGNAQQSYFHTAHQEHGQMRPSSSPMNHTKLQQNAMLSARGSPTPSQNTPLPPVTYVQTPPQQSRFTSTRRHD